MSESMTPLVGSSTESKQKRSALSVVAASHSWAFVKLCPKEINFLLAAVGPAVHHCS